MCRSCDKYVPACVGHVISPDDKKSVSPSQYAKEPHPMHSDLTRVHSDMSRPFPKSRSSSDIPVQRNTRYMSPGAQSQKALKLSTPSLKSPELKDDSHLLDNKKEEQVESSGSLPSLDLVGDAKVLDEHDEVEGEEEGQ